MTSKSLVLIPCCTALIWAAGCASRPAPYPQEAQPVPMYRYEPPPSGPGYTQAPGTAPAAAATNPAPGTQPSAPGQTEVFPSSPGPNYVWMPSYWTTSVRGDWTWIGGHYVARQGVTDEQLRAARGMLEQARTGLSGRSLKKINNAIDEVNDALDNQ